jgi:hypothetical protein
MWCHNTRDEKMLIKRLLRNKKGTAEVIGSVMFIVILLFFFTNVYLWHDAVTKEMNDLYVQKINSPITISVMTSPYELNVTNKGGVDAKLAILWVDVVSTNSGTPNRFNGYFNLTQQNIVVLAGSSIKVTWYNGVVNSYGEHYSYQPGDSLQLKMVTTFGNTAACRYP